MGRRMFSTLPDSVDLDNHGFASPRSEASVARSVARGNHPGTVVVAHPSPDLYGSDRLLVETVTGLIGAGWRVVVYLPTDGPLIPLLTDRGAQVRIVGFPVLRKASLSPRGLLLLAVTAPVAVVRLARLVRRTRPAVVYVSTLTIPFWLLAARLAGSSVVCHVREAEETQPRILRFGLVGPLLLASSVVTNSRASRQALLDVVPWLRARSRVVYNGVAGPIEPQLPASDSSTRGLALVARLSPRKGIDVALEALGILVSEGYDLSLDICGTAFPGYEWYEDKVRARAAMADIAGRVTFSGYVNPTWPVLASASVVLAPSRLEPFGNTAVEGLLARRPVVASATQGLAEIIRHERTGLLVPPDDPAALAAAIARILDDEDLATRLADNGYSDALQRFSVDRYRAEMAEAFEGHAPADASSY